jgi:hypothetical protein
MDKEMLAELIKGRRGKGIDLKILIGGPEMEEEDSDEKSDLAPEVNDMQAQEEGISEIQKLLMEQPAAGGGLQSKVMRKRMEK